MQFDGFDWDAGNREKCCKHGLTVSQIEEVFSRSPSVFPDAKHSLREVRLRGIGRLASGRWVFFAFTIRRRHGRSLIRPISVRFMHLKEVKFYERVKAEVQTLTSLTDRSGG